MAVLETIRVKFGILITVLIAVALLGFIIDIPSCTQYFQSSKQEDKNVGYINGQPVSLSEFSAELELINSASQSSSNKEEQKLLNDEAWQSMIIKKVFIPNAQAAGLNVIDKEVIGVMSRKIDSPAITQNPMFCDENGIFYPDSYVAFVKLCSQNPSYKGLWDKVYSDVYKNLYHYKYTSLLANSNITNDLMLKNQLNEYNTTFDIEFISIPFDNERDTTIVVSDAEISDYYNSHIKLYKQVPSRDIEYVHFVTKPSEKDILETKKFMEDVHGEFSTTDDMALFLSSNSDRNYSEHWYADGELNTIPSELKDFVSSNNSGVSEIIKDGDSFYTVRIMKQAKVADSIYVKTINIMEPDSLFNNAPAQWISQISGFESLMSMPKGTTTVLNGRKFQIVDRSKLVNKKQIAILEKEIIPGEETIENYRSMANDFLSKVNSADNFAQVAKELGYYPHTVNNMYESAEKLGSVDNTKDVTRWAFNAGNGQVSDVIPVDLTNFIVAAVKGVHDEEYTPVSELYNRIKEHLYREKYAQKKLDEVSSAIKGVESLNQISNMYAGATISSKDDLIFQDSDYNGVEPKLIGAASVAEVGKISKPIAGNAGIYIFKVTNRETKNTFNEQEIIDRNMQKVNYTTSSMLLPEMMNAANVKDYRPRYF